MPQLAEEGEGGRCLCLDEKLAVTEVKGYEAAENAPGQGFVK